MNNICLSKEVIEALISRTYSNANNFVWDNDINAVTFDYDTHIVHNDVTPYMEQIKAMAAEISFLNGAVYQADKFIRAAVSPIDDEEDKKHE